MNGLASRINPKGSTKMKTSIGFPPVTFTSPENIDENLKNIYDEFLNASTSDEQLQIVNKMLSGKRSGFDSGLVSFLSLVYFEATAKHPVKGFLTRHITKKSNIQEEFAEQLAVILKSYIKDRHSDYSSYVHMVSQTLMCTENFPAGVRALKLVELKLAEYLMDCLECCITTLRETTNLAPTQRNEVYNVAHLTLRLLLHIVQKVSKKNTTDLITVLKNVRLYIKDLLFDEDSPMDTKSICGILYLSLRILEDGPDLWIKILESDPDPGDDVSVLLFNESAQLSLYSAVATVTPAEELQTRRIGHKVVVIWLADKIIAIGERNCSEPIFTLGVTRAIAQLTRILERVEDRQVGCDLLQRLLHFVWAHLDHHMDSVRHLAVQALTRAVGYSSGLNERGDPSAMDMIMSGVRELGSHRRGYFVCVSALAAQGGEKVLGEVGCLLHALSEQHVQASATTALETLIRNSRRINPGSSYEQWVLPILDHVSGNQLDSSVLNILESLMSKVVDLDQDIVHYIIPHIQSLCETPSILRANLKCVLLLVSVVRKSRSRKLLPPDHQVLRVAAVHSDDETRILSLSLVVDSPKSTEVFCEGDLDFVLFYLRYNCNAQAPHFRQLTLALMQKLLKRIEDSYKVLLRQNDPNVNRSNGDYYLSFMGRLRQQCFDSLFWGANYSRRVVALNVLAWSHQLNLEGFQSEWKEEYVEKLLLHFEDTYENNKLLALQILEKCPVELVKNKKYSTSLEIEDIFRQASSLKPTDCVSASFKLIYLKNKIPERILEGTHGEVSVGVERVSFALCTQLAARVRRELGVCGRSVAEAARDAPVYGTLHAIRTVLATLDKSISSEPLWSDLIAEVIEMCVAVSGVMEPVVNSSAPEGHLPMDHQLVHGNVLLDNGQPVTSQMVLLCAWRSVKEVSLLLGTICSRFSITGEGCEKGTLSSDQVLRVGKIFTKLLTETKHRGAFEQAYVGFTLLLERLCACVGPLGACPLRWLRALCGGLAARRTATRRSAGLPYMIQALVTTELQVNGNPKYVHECMATLLQLAQATTLPTPVRKDEETNSFGELFDSSEADNGVREDSLVETRTHSLNILRALFRNSVLEESVSGFVGEGLKVALAGFDGDTWMERNSSTLLFASLMGRVFGARRTAAASRRMTGRIFFLRYPHLYDFILNKLVHAASHSLSPGVFPALAVLGRLYPSALEGAASALRLARLAPAALALAASRVRAARLLAAKAVLPLVAPDLYIPHLQSLLSLISNPDIKRNHCHGILLQLTTLLSGKPEDLELQEDDRQRLVKAIEGTYWILEQGVGKPCYMILDEYAKMINSFIWRFPALTEPTMLQTIKRHLHEILFTDIKPTQITSGREICLANFMYLYIVILNIILETDEIPKLIFKGLAHNSYEVVISTMNYLLILHNIELQIDNCEFQAHLKMLVNKDVILNLKEKEEYLDILCKVFKCHKYSECVQKALKLLSLENNTQSLIISTKFNINHELIFDEDVFTKLIYCVQNEHENLTHIYLGSLSNFVHSKLNDSNMSDSIILEVIRVIFACSSPDNSDSTRNVVVSFMEKCFGVLWKMGLNTLTDSEKFEFKATLHCILATTLEDDDATIRQRAAAVGGGPGGCAAAVGGGPGGCAAAVGGGPGGCAAAVGGGPGGCAGQLPATAAEQLRAACRGRDGAAVLVALALLDFKAVVCLTDEASDECRVFDQNEKYNIHLEESMWTNACSEQIANICGDHERASDLVLSVIDDPKYRGPIEKLCNSNIVMFRKMIQGIRPVNKVEIVNPKVEIFIKNIFFNV